MASAMPAAMTGRIAAIGFVAARESGLRRRDELGL
jgi:hypothetical protein